MCPVSTLTRCRYQGVAEWQGWRQMILESRKAIDKHYGESVLVK